MKPLPLGPNWEARHIRYMAGTYGGRIRPGNLVRPVCLMHGQLMCKNCNLPDEFMKKCLILQKMLFEFIV